MQDFKEHWVLIRTPEQFSIFFDCCAEVAEEAGSKMAPYFKKKVDGLSDFEKDYVIPELYLQVDKLRMTLTGKQNDLYGLAPFLEDPEHFGFEKMENMYVLEVANKKALADVMQDLIDLTETWGWQLNL